MKDPVEVIARTRKRLARLATTQSLLCLALPLAVTLGAAASLDVINRLAFDHFGYLIEGVRAKLWQESLLGVAFAESFAAAWFAWRSHADANDFVRTAERIDQCVHGRQEIVTLATLADPAHSATTGARSPLFPLLWRHALSYLDKFEPQREFKLDVGEPIRRSSLLAIITAGIVSIATLALMTAPTPAQAVVRRLARLASSMDSSAAAPAQQMTAAARDVAKDLENPRLPLEQKLAELQALKQELEKFESEQQKAQAGEGNSSGRGNGGGGSGGGSGKGSGPGSGSGKAGTGSGNGRGGKQDQEMVELRNDLSKAEAKLEQQSASGKQARTAQNSSGKGNGSTPQPGSSPGQTGGQGQSPGSGAFRIPQPGALAANHTPSGQTTNSRQNDKGSLGDTHLGEFPKAGNYQRYYKLGEGGAGLTIRDARYVTFQLPSEVASTGAGAPVSDSGRPRATTPYTNAPFKQERLPISPDEQQLVPPRYRELIH
jgi:hypothetical protein